MSYSKMVVVILLFAAICSNAQNVDVLIQEHRRLLAKNGMESLEHGRHSVVGISIYSCCNKKVPISVYLKDNIFSLYMKLPGVELVQTGVLKATREGIEILLSNNITTTGERSWNNVVRCNECGIICCPRCGASSLEGCSTVRFGCRVCDHPRALHTYIAGRYKKAGEIKAYILFTITPTQIKVGGNYRKVLPGGEKKIC